MNVAITIICLCGIIFFQILTIIENHKIRRILRGDKDV